TLTFPDRTLRSDGCWSPNPAVKVSSSSVVNGKWRVECKTQPGDAKQERGVYTITASVVDQHAQLELVEESNYDWQLKQSHCVAKVRIIQRMSRGGVIVEPAAATAPCVPGPLAKLRLRPGDARIAPGEKQCFTVRGTDAAGCAVPLEHDALSWELKKPNGATGTLSGGCFKAASNAAEAEGRFEISVSAGGVHDNAQLDVTTTDLSDIIARRSAGGDLDVSDDGDGLASALGIEAVVNQSSLAVKLAISALLLACIGASIALLLRRRPRAKKKRARRMAADEDDEDDSGHPPRHSAINSLAPRTGDLAGSGEQFICPTCRRGVPEGVARCPHDGTKPVPYAEFVKAAREAEAGARTCPSCGAQVVSGALFCGKCGTKVRP
ncbi:MAG TPA: zinc ribbon domain-containing protein, partial [Polyangiales bacterium]